MIQTDNLTGKTVLVTGASGLLGSRTVAFLAESARNVHAFVRKSSRVDHLQFPNVKIFYGDIAELESLEAAFTGVDFVIHAAADTSGTEEGGRHATIKGTQNILKLCTTFNVTKLVYISSCSVYGVAEYRSGQIVDENAPLEKNPELRGHYSWAKLEAEKLITQYMTEGKTPVVCLRPGTIYGPGFPVYTPMIGFSLGNRVFAIIGNGDFILPLVYVDNMVDAIILSLTSENSNGQTYNVIDVENITKNSYLQLLIHKLYPKSFSIFIPYSMLNLLVLIQEKLLKALGRRPFMSCYRLVSSQKPIVYDATKIVRELNWQPDVSFVQAANNLIAFEKKQYT